MLTLTINLDALSFYIVVADIVLLLCYVLYIKHRDRQRKRAVTVITGFITEYFSNSGTEAKVSCYRLEQDRHFVVLIESEPLKRFRYSNILENNLINHIQKTTGNVVERIYWRFPVQVSQQTILPYKTSSAGSDDDYFSQEPDKAKLQPGYGVAEISWEEFEHTKPGS